jgi:hypothetical protein
VTSRAALLAVALLGVYAAQPAPAAAPDTSQPPPGPASGNRGVIATPSSTPVPTAGLTAAPLVAQAYDAILDADFAALRAQLPAVCPPAPPEVCGMLGALALWWELSLEPESRKSDARFVRSIEQAIAATEAWTRREPQRAEAWFYAGAAYGARVQWRVLREQRLAAARDGKRIKEALEQSLALDPGLHDANFGLGMYRYYADIGPAALKLLRWMLWLPGGDRRDGLRKIVLARDQGAVVAGEADYQLHLIYLWYEKRSRDALAIVRRLQQRYPHNPLFYEIEAEVHDKYFHDAQASLAASMRLLALAADGQVHEARLASVRARLNIAVQAAALGDRARAIDLLTALVSENPARPQGAAARARSLLTTIRAR